MNEVDRRDRLTERPFSYRVARGNRIFIYWRGKQVRVLKGENSQEFLADVDGADILEAQLVMAKITGNFKRGNEKGR
jgi:hypothetical protein